MTVNAFATIDDFNQSHMEFALDYADELLNTSPSARFEILVGGKATVLVLENMTPVRERLQAAAANPRLKVYVCADDTERLRKQFGTLRVTLLEGIVEAHFEQKVEQYEREDWLRIDVAESV